MVGDINQGREVLAQRSLLLNLLAPMPTLFDETSESSDNQTHQKRCAQ